MVGELGGVDFEDEVEDFDVVVVLREIFVFFSFRTSGFFVEPRKGYAVVVFVVVDVDFLSSGGVGFLMD